MNLSGVVGLIGNVLQILLDVAGILVALSCLVTGVAALRQRFRTPTPAVGDELVSVVLDRCWNRGTRRQAAVLVDAREGTPRARSAFIGCDEHTPYEIGSVSKALTGLLLADVAACGDIDLDAELAQLHPAYDGAPIGTTTLRQIAHHTSGLPGLPRSPAMFVRAVTAQIAAGDPYRYISGQQVLRTGGRARLRAPGQYRYSNLAASVGGLVAADALRTSFAPLLHDRVLALIGMTQTQVGEHPAGMQRGWTKSGRRTALWKLTGYAPAGGVVSTAHDMAKLATALLLDRAPGREALRDDGLFWVIETDPASSRTRAWHNGETGGYSAYIGVYPEAQCAVVVLSATAAASHQEAVSLQLIQGLIAERNAQNVRDQETPKSIPATWDRPRRSEPAE